MLVATAILQHCTEERPKLFPFVKCCAKCHASHAEDDSPQLVCNMCNHAWCKTCKVDWHTGLSCDEHLRQVLSHALVQLTQTSAPIVVHPDKRLLNACANEIVPFC